MKFPPSKEQVEIFDVFDLNETDIKNIIISAVAGSGKTTTLLMLLERIPKNKTVLFMAYNSSIAEELRRRVPPSCRNVNVMTVHSYGKSILETTGEVVVNSHKYNQLLNIIINTEIKKDLETIKKYKFDRTQKSYVTKIIELYRKSQEVEQEFNIGQFKKNIISLCSNGRLQLIDLLNKVNGVKELREITKHHGYETIWGDAECAWYLAKIGLTIKDDIDFTDMVTFPIRMGIKQPKYDYVFIDECQDINICQRTLMLGAIKEDGGRFVAVGDEKQAIYGFAGADAESFNKIRSLPNTVEMNLSVSYRCPKQVVETVQGINPLIKHFEGNDKGIIINDFKVEHLINGDMVLCRFTKPLVGLCISLIKAGRKAYLMGSDIGKSMVNLIKDKEKVREEFTMTNVFGRLYKDLEKTLENLRTKNNLTKDEAVKVDAYASLKEKIEMIEIIAEDDEDPKSVITKIIDLFTDDKGPGICLSTVHKSKGLEADRVIILNPSLMPSSRAKLDWQIVQEDNLIYVAHTRTKKLLGFIHDFEKKHVSREDTVSLVKESKHVGFVGEKIKLDLKIVAMKDYNGQYGPTVINELVDKDGNIFSLWGKIKSDMLLDDEKMRVEVGDSISCYGKISEHSEFQNVKTNKLTRLTKF